jgi:N-acetylneuraminic acid mutarotase
VYYLFFFGNWTLIFDVERVTMSSQKPQGKAKTLASARYGVIEDCVSTWLFRAFYQLVYQYSQDSYLYFFGGSEKSSTTAEFYDWTSSELVNTGESYNLTTHEWTLLKPMNVVRIGAAAATLGGDIYVVGGSCDDDSVSQTVERYNPVIDRWFFNTPMNIPRQDHGVAVLHGKLYAVGGCNRTHYLCTVECYDPEENRWNYVASMSTVRFRHAVAVLNGQLYAVGGQDDQGRQLNSAEYYDPVKDEWATVTPLNVPRDSHGLVVLNGKLYVLGGHTYNQGALKSVESYDAVSQQWSFVAPFNGEPRSQCAAVIKDEVLYLVTSNGLYVYHPETGLRTLSPLATPEGTLHLSLGTTLTEDVRYERRDFALA